VAIPDCSTVTGSLLSKFKAGLRSAKNYSKKFIIPFLKRNPSNLAGKRVEFFEATPFQLQTLLFLWQQKKIALNDDSFEERYYPRHPRLIFLKWQGRTSPKKPLQTKTAGHLPRRPAA
jgi:hypothetical protein